MLDLFKGQLPLLRFIAIFLLSYALLFTLSNNGSIQKKGRDFFFSTSGKLIEALYPKAMIKWNKPGNDPNKLEMRFTDRADVKRKTDEARRNKQFGQLRIESYAFPFLVKEFLFMPISLLLALILATPQSFKSKGKSLLIGFLLFGIFILVKSSILAYDTFVQYSIYHPGSFGKSILKAIVALLRLVGFGLIITLLIWLVSAPPIKLIVNLKKRKTIPQY